MLLPRTSKEHTYMQSLTKLSSWFLKTRWWITWCQRSVGQDFTLRPVEKIVICTVDEGLVWLYAVCDVVVPTFLEHAKKGWFLL